MMVSVTFICLKQAIEHLQVFNDIFSKSGAQKTATIQSELEEVWLEFGRRREILKLRQG